ncbi:MAG: FtsX-like permease family protein [Clostridiales bacterium]|uniref:ABC transporter permease n=2 Tax=Clostridium isatidis TaxID=182773 RepID=A0A343JB50_9CLOT|nr:ABC transporter permease [Clostridium isatidis]NLZ33347.1 FtsX-like permease family protein [Clostridiales bacterium]
MFKNAFMKDVFKDIARTKGRFISIFAIIALGVAFFSGIKISPIAMKKTADKYYDDYNFMDITIYSTLGLTDDDISEIKKLDGVLEVFPTYSLDAVIKDEGSEKVLKVMGIPLKDEYKVNQYKIMEGRLPEKENECLVEEGKIDSLALNIGDKITLSSGTSEDLKEKLALVEYEIVGKVRTPNYLSFEKGSSSIGNGKISSFIVVPQENFKIEAYTEAYVTVEGAKKLNSYSDKYFDLVDDTKISLESLGSERADIRYDEIIEEATKKLNEGKTELEEQRRKGQEDLDKAKKEIEDGEKKLEEGEKELAKKELEYNLTMVKADNEISLAEYKIKDGKVALETAKTTLESQAAVAESTLKIAKETLESLKDNREDIDKRIKEAEDRINKLNISEEEKKALKAQLESLYGNRAEIDKGINYIENQIKSTEEQLAAGRAEIAKKEEELANGERQLEEKKKELEEGKKEAQKQFEEAKKELEKGKKDLEKGKEEYEKGKETFEKEISAAEAKIKKAENDIKAIEEPSWYVLNREGNYSYMDYRSNAESIDKLAKVFPVFFFLVAALVCLTTMTRMVDEQRVNIGTLKALGYSKAKIVSKYLIYSFSASFLGSLVGLAIGYTLFPTVVITAYGIMYTIPGVELDFNIPLALIVSLVAILVTTLSSFFACYKELMETPSALMRPKAPKEGKRILLERISFIWNRLSFIGKVTVRNIFRYKKRFFMTVFGIAGCTALIVTGFGIKDSIKTIIDKQFGEIFKYNLLVSIDKEAGDLEKDEILSYIDDLSEVDNSLLVLSENAKVKTDDGDKDITVLVPESQEEFKDFVSLQNRSSKESYSLNNKGIIISEKAAKDAKVKLGDEVKVKINNIEASLKVEGIAENYTMNYIYMTEKYYKDSFGLNIHYNSILVNTKENTNEEEISKTIMENSIVKGVSFNTSIKENFDNTIKNLNYVVLILIVSAGSLAFVVLYNLTNLNISERMREIATIKVLGFYNNEVSAYIYRENVLLTIIGIFLGEFLGILLHRFIMVTVEMDNMMFGRNVDLISFIISAVLTVVFSVLVNIVMYYKLKNVKMVESLKSVD